MKIVIWESLPVLGGGQRIALAVGQALDSKGQCVYILPTAGEFSRVLKAHGFSYYFMNCGSFSLSQKTITDVVKLLLRWPDRFFSSLRLIKKLKPDIIYANSTRTFVYAAPIGKTLGIPVIFHIHNFFDDSKTISLINLLGRMDSVKKIVFVSESLSEEFPLLKGKGLVIYNGIFRGRSVIDYPVRQEFGIPEDRKLVTTVGFLSSSKGQDVVIKATKRVINEYNKVHFLLVGTARDDEGPGFAEYLRNLAIKMKVDKYLTFIGYRNDVANILFQSHVNLISSREACPLVLGEACLAGTPSICADIGGAAELVRKTGGGILYRFKDAEDLSKKILMLLKNSSMYQELVVKTKDAADYFSPNLFTTKIAKLVEEVVSAQ